MEKPTELAIRICEDGQPIRAIHNYLIETFEDLIDVKCITNYKKLSFDENKQINLNEAIEMYFDNSKMTYEDFVGYMLDIVSGMNDDLNK